MKDTKWKHCDSGCGLLCFLNLTDKHLDLVMFDAVVIVLISDNNANANLEKIKSLEYWHQEGTFSHEPQQDKKWWRSCWETTPWFGNSTKQDRKLYRRCYMQLNTPLTMRFPTSLKPCWTKFRTSAIRPIGSFAVLNIFQLPNGFFLYEICSLNQNNTHTPTHSS